jgi:hypothetical protein
MATLAQLAQAYLNQGLPSISGIFQPRANTPVEEPVEETIPGITPQLLQPMGGGGGGFNPYNINPNDPNVRTSRNYSPYSDRRLIERSFYNSDTAAQKMMDNYPDYYQGPKPTGIAKALGTAVNFIPGIGGLKRGAEFLSGIMPVNKRANLENQLLGSGIMLDDIGRIVTDNYNTPQGIMAGYNAAKLNDKSFDKRTSNISKSLKEKGLSQTQIDAVISEIEKTGEYTGDITDEMLGVNNLFSNLVNVNKAKFNFATAKQKANLINELKEISKLPKDIQQYTQPTRTREQAIERDNRGDSRPGGGGGFSDVGAGSSSRGAGKGGGYDAGNFCFDPSTPIQMADGSEKKIKEIQLGDDTKGGEVTGVFQFKASDEIHDYKGVTVAGSHYVKEDGRFIMVKDSPLSVKIDKIPVVYSLDTSGRRIFINDIEFADYNGDGIAKGFLANAGVDITGFDKEVLRQVENRLI